MKQQEAAAYYPVFLNIKRGKCVVVGGGQVALRKVVILLEHGADIVVISPDLCPELVKLAENSEIRVLSKEFEPGDLNNAFVTIAATDNNEINLQIVEEARNKASLVNVVDDAANSDFIVPSYLRRGDITIAVSTGGKSPALARKIRSRLENDIGKEYALLVTLVNEVRAEIKQQMIKIDSEDWQQALDIDTLLDLINRGEKEKAKATLLSNLKVNQQ